MKKDAKLNLVRGLIYVPDMFQGNQHFTDHFFLNSKIIFRHENRIETAF